MTPQQQLIQKMLKQRETVLELEPGKKVWIRRPPDGEFEAKDFSQGRMQFCMDLACEYVVGWGGFHESDLLGAAGGSDAVEFHSDLWRVVVTDRSDWLLAIATRVLELVNEEKARRAEVAKNSQPS